MVKFTLVKCVIKGWLFTLGKRPTLSQVWKKANVFKINDDDDDGHCCVASLHDGFCLQ